MTGTISPKQTSSVPDANLFLIFDNRFCKCEVFAKTGWQFKQLHIVQKQLCQPLKLIARPYNFLNQIFDTY